jgi:hypothetical protein
MQVNAEDKIGEVKTVTNACAPAGAVYSYVNKYIPQNGEYEWAGEGGECNYCSADIPKGVDKGCFMGASCWPILGARGTYKRKTYNADPKECCIQEKSIIGGLTCDPKYRDPLSGDCFQYIDIYCMDENNLFDSEVCHTFCAKNPKLCNDRKSDICNTISGFKSNPACKEWCRKNDGWCDISATSYCLDPANAVDSFCSCLNSDLQKTNYNPMCEDIKCIDHGYGTSGMLASLAKGCQIVDCSTYLKVSAGGNVDFKDVTLQERCGGGPSTASQRSLWKYIWDRKWVFLIVLLVAILLMIWIVFVVLKINDYFKQDHTLG